MTSYMDIVEAFDGYSGPKNANLLLLGSIFLTIFVTYFIINTLNYFKKIPSEYPLYYI
jgi:hypothetical protein